MSKTFEEMLDEIVENIDTLEEETAKEACELFGLVGLPRDANDEPIHIGDLMALNDDCAFYVEEMHLVASGKDGCIWQVSNNAGSLVKAHMLHHVPEDTVEGILMEVAMRVHRDTLADKDSTDVTDLLERLRDLMGDDDK